MNVPFIVLLILKKHLIEFEKMGIARAVMRLYQRAKMNIRLTPHICNEFWEQVGFYEGFICSAFTNFYG